MQRSRTGTGRNGFTLVELMVTLAIGIILMAGVYQYFISQQRTYSSQDELLRVQQNARVAETLISKAVQLSGSYLPDIGGGTTISMRGQAILAATDRYLVLQYDDPLNTADLHFVSADEVVVFAVSKTTPAANANGTPVGDGTIDTTVYFDKNGDGNITDADAHTLKIGLNLAGPPYTLYRITPNANGTINAEAVADNVDNFVLRYFDRNGTPVPLNPATGVATLATTDLTQDQRAQVRSIEVELVMRTGSQDPQYNGGTWNDAAANTVATRDASGAIAVFPGFTDNHRRRKYVSRITPRSLAVNNCGRLDLNANPGAPTCPNGSIITATVLNQYGEPAALAGPIGVPVTFRSDAGTLSAATVTTAVATGKASTTLDYNLVARQILVWAQADVECVDSSGATATATLHGSIVVDFQPGLADSVTVDGPVPNTLETCNGPDFFEFTAHAWDVCGNEVAPQTAPALVFEPVDALGGGAFGTIDGIPAGEFNTISQTFKVTQPAVGPYGAVRAATAYGEFLMNIDAPVVPGWVSSLTGVPMASNVEVRPAPDDHAAIFGVPLVLDPTKSTVLSDCDAPISDTFNAFDCKDNMIYKLAAPAIATLTPAAPGPADQGTLQSTNNGVAGTTINILDSANGVGTFDLTYNPPGYCSLPHPPTTLYQPDISLAFPFQPALNGGVTLQPCTQCVLESAGPITRCTGSTVVKIYNCNPGTDVEFEVTSSGAGRNGTFTANDGSITLAEVGRATPAGAGSPYVGTATLYIGSSIIGDVLTVTAYPLDSAGNRLPSCGTLNVAVSNTCEKLTVTSNGAPIGGAGVTCPAKIDQVEFEVADCQFDLVDDAIVTAYTIYQDNVSKKWFLHDYEEVDLNLLGGSQVAGSSFYERLEATLAVEASEAPTVNDRVLGYKPARFVRFFFAYTDKRDPTNDDHRVLAIRNFPPGHEVVLADLQNQIAVNGCHELTPALTPPVDVCFLNAITTGGAAVWSGNMNVHWGDVVIMGNADVTGKMIEKLQAGQFDGSKYPGNNKNDRFVDVYVGEAPLAGGGPDEGDPNTGDYGEFKGAQPFAPLGGRTPGVIHRPYQAQGYGNFFRNVPYKKMKTMVQWLDYDMMKAIAKTRGVYWYAASTAGPLLPGAETVTRLAGLVPAVMVPGGGITLEDLLDLTKGYHDGTFVFVDAVGTPAGSQPNLTGAQIDALPTASLPRLPLLGGYTEGIVYIAGSIDVGGGGGSQNVTVQKIATEEDHYEHADTNWTPCGLPIRSLQASVQEPPVPAISLNVNVNGAFYLDGEYGAGAPGAGNFSVYGAVTAERGFTGGGTPEVWFNEFLSTSFTDSACVTCSQGAASACGLDVVSDPNYLQAGGNATLTICGAGNLPSWPGNPLLSFGPLGNSPYPPKDTYTVDITAMAGGSTSVPITDGVCTHDLTVEIDPGCFPNLVANPSTSVPVGDPILLTTAQPVTWIPNPVVSPPFDEIARAPQSLTVQAKAIGSEVITAEVSPTCSQFVTITATDPCAGFTVAPAATNVGIGANPLFTVNAVPPGAAVIKWTSSNPGVALIDAITGVATGVAMGTTTITAEDAPDICPNPTAQLSVACSVGVAPAAVSLFVGSSVALTPSGLLGPGAWTSSDPAVAAVDASGKVTGVAAGGPVIITLTDTTTGCFAETRVTVMVPPPCTLSQITPGDTSLTKSGGGAPGESVDLLAKDVLGNPVLASWTIAGQTGNFNCTDAAMQCNAVSFPISTDRLRVQAQNVQNKTMTVTATELTCSVTVTITTIN